MHIQEFSMRVVTFKLAAGLERYEMDLRRLAGEFLDAQLWRRLQSEFGELRILGASLPRLSVAWVAVLVSRARLLQAACGRTGPAFAAVLQEHLAAVEGVRRRCLRMMGAQAVVLA